MRKLFFIASLLLILPLLVAFPAFAQSTNENVILPADQFHEGDYFAGGDTVQIAGTVNGDAYAAGGTVIVDGIINGDLLLGGGNVTISGIIRGDVRTGGGNVTFSAADIAGNVTVGGGNVVIDSTTVVRGSLVAGAGNLQVLAPIGRGATIGGGTVLIANSVGGNITAGVGELTLASGADINGNLTYWSDTQANIASGASVSGTIKQEIPKSTQEQNKEIGKGITAVVAGLFFALKFADIAWLVIVGFALIFFFPNYMARSSDFIAQKFGWAFLTGLIAVIILPIIGIILLITLVGIPAATILFFAYILALWLGRIFAIYALGRAIFTRTGNKKATYLAYVAGIVIYLILSLIPIVGFITDILIMLTGLGALLAMKKAYYAELRAKKII